MSPSWARRPDDSAHEPGTAIWAKSTGTARATTRSDSTHRPHLLRESRDRKEQLHPAGSGQAFPPRPVRGSLHSSSRRRDGDGWGVPPSVNQVFRCWPASLALEPEAQPSRPSTTTSLSWLYLRFPANPNVSGPTTFSYIRLQASIPPQPTPTPVPHRHTDAGSDGHAGLPQRRRRRGSDAATPVLHRRRHRFPRPRPFSRRRRHPVPTPTPQATSPR
jgi:hypothetical protein